MRPTCDEVGNEQQGRNGRRWVQAFSGRDDSLAFGGRQDACLGLSRKTVEGIDLKVLHIEIVDPDYRDAVLSDFG